MTKQEELIEALGENTIIMFHHHGGGGRNHKIDYLGLKSLCNYIEEDRYNEFCLLDDTCPIVDEDGNERERTDEEWVLTDLGSNILLETKEDIKSTIGVISFDGEYNTLTFRSFDTITDEEMDVLLNVFFPF